MYYIYILHSANSDLYYTGYSDNPHRRLIEHNSKPQNTFTSKHRPWELKAYFECGSNESNAIKLERVFRRQKSRSLLMQLCDPSFIPAGLLAQLVRVPHMRD